MNVVLESHYARIPERADEYAAGYDLFLPNDVSIKPGRNVIPLDFRIELLPGWEAQIRPRSGFSAKGMEGFSPNDLTTPQRFDADVILGTIDENYRGIVGVIIKSYEKTPFILKRGTRVAQMVMSKYEAADLWAVDKLSETERGSNGFGHTGAFGSVKSNK